MHRLLPALIAGLLVVAAGQAQAAPVNFTGSLSLSIGSLPPIPFPGSGVADVTGPTTFTLPAGIFATTAVVIPVTDPAAFPILGVQVTGANDSGSFAGGSGPMPIVGQSKVCLFAPCEAPPPANVSVPLSVVGAGGTTTVSALVNLTVIGAPWTTGTVSIGTATMMGGTANDGAEGGQVQMVTPVFISTNIGASAVLPAFAILDLDFQAPEPGAVALGSAAIAGLLFLGWRRRQS